MKQLCYLLLSGFSLLFSLTNSVYEGFTTRSSNIRTSYNTRLCGYVISNQRTLNMLGCAHRCLSDRRCASFNFRGKIPKGQGNCELNGVESLNNKAELKQADGWTYGVLEGKNWQKPNERNFTFITLGAFGAKGPKNTLGYKGTNLEGMVQLHKGIQVWAVPYRGTYSIEALGASGGNGTNNTGTKYWRLGGYGARIKANFYFIEGTILKILVGQSGLCAPVGQRRPGGGGGGTFVTLQDNVPLIIAGGGGGGAAPWIGFHHGDDAQLQENGSTYGGTEGSGGFLYDVYYKTFSRLYKAGAGGGLKTNGASGNLTQGGFAFVNGGEGGEGGVGGDGAQGGFGGGGAASLYPGGGGGYSGGGVVRATQYTIAGGGGSFTVGSMVEKSQATERGSGRVEVRLIKPDIG